MLGAAAAAAAGGGGALRVLSHYAASSSSGVQSQLMAAAGTVACSVLGSVDAFAPSAFVQWQGRRWATKKQGGSTKNKKDSRPKYLGAKLGDGQLAFPGQVLARQRGTHFHPGHNVGVGVDFTLYAKTVGVVAFRREKQLLRGRPPSAAKTRRVVDVLPLGGDWSEGYADKARAMVAARNEIRRAELGLAAKYGRR